MNFSLPSSTISGMTALSERRLSAQEYLELERTSEVRHEFVDGQRFSMPGVSNAHSKSTEAADRGLKLEEYRKIESLQRYVLVDEETKLVTVYAGDASGWRVEFLEHSGEIDIPCLETTLSLEQIYAGLEC
jgi:Uma2 family endonuclease